MSGPLVELIPEALDGERVDRVVSLLAGCSRSEAATLVTAGAVTLDGGVVTAGKRRVQAGQMLSVDVARAARAGAPRTRSDHPGDRRPRGRRRRRRRQAGRAGGAPGRRAGRRDPRATGCWPATRRWPTSASPTGRASSTASTATRPGSWSWPGHRRPTSAWSRRCRPGGSPAGTRPWSGACRRPPTASSTRRSAARRARPRAWRWWPAASEARTRYEVRDRYGSPSRLAPRLPAGDRPHAPDPRPPGQPRPPRRRRPRLRGRPRGLAVPRMVLHAGHLAFAHPVSRQPLTFNAPLPADLAAVLARLQPA